MATTVAQICNLSLLRVGVTRRITDITDDTVEGRACATLYEQCRDEVLEAFDWPFARNSVDLAVIEEFDEGEWGYSYRMPGDAIKLRYLVSGVRNDVDTPPFALTTDTIGRLILTDIEDAEIVYTKRIEDPALFSPGFASVVAWRMAVDLAPALSKSSDWTTRAERMYPASLSKASADALNGIIDDEASDSEATRSRT